VKAVAVNPVPLLGGKSVYCINEQQMEEAHKLTEQTGEASVKIQAFIEEAQEELTRNEQAALAFMLIKRLKDTSVH